MLQDVSFVGGSYFLSANLQSCKSKINRLMNHISRIIIRITALFFEKALFSLLYVTSWKKDTIQTNLNYTQINVIADKESFYRQLVRNLAHHVSEIIFDFGTFKKLPNELTRYPVRVGGTDYAIAPQSEVVLKKMQKGGIFLTAHYGNYEAMGPWLCRLGIPLKASYIPLKPAWLNRIVENRIRSVNGKPYSINARTPREFLELLDSQNLFCLLMDQDSRIPSATTGNFLGHDVHVNPLPGFLLRHRPNTPVFICWIEESRNSKTLHAIEVEHDCDRRFWIESGMTEAESVADIFNQWLEKQILDKPALWYGWTHRRFFSTAPNLYQK